MLTNLIEANYKNNKFGLFIIYGQQGIGKSSYCLLVLNELGLNWKEHLYFRPKEFLDRIADAYKNRERLKVLVLDDGGYNLSCYDWNNPFVRQFVKFITLPRHVVANVLITTPSPSMLVKKIRTLDSYFVKVVKDSDKHHPLRRLAKGYKSNFLPSGYRYFRLVYEDTFSLNQLDLSIYKQYEEYRYSYIADAIEGMVLALKEQEKKMEDESRSSFIPP